MVLQKDILYRRSVSGILFGIIVLALLLAHPFTRHLFIWLVAMFCSFEYLGAQTKNAIPKFRLAIYAFIFGPLPAIFNYLEMVSFDPLLHLVLISVLYFTYLMGGLFFEQKTSSIVWIHVMTCFFYIGMPVLLLSQYMLNNGPDQMVLQIVLLIWVTDTFAYLTGSKWGRRPLFSRVSPKKTIEGTLGALVAAIATGIIFYYIWSNGSLIYYLGFALVVWFFGIWGDLIASKIKRTNQIKDFGTIMPGHGGALDRFDSFIFVIPFVLLYQIYFFTN
jgi:phosphatidate cytidylyltransferase